jgi:uncharacterized caspase-like protein
VKSPAKIVLMDTCRTSQGVKNLGVSTPDFIRNLVRLGEGDVSFFFSCSGGEESYESNTLLHGAFTYSLLEGLNGPADADRDGQISLSELSKYLKTNVPPLARRWQGSDATQTPEVRLGTVDPGATFARVSSASGKPNRKASTGALSSE